MRSLPEPLMSPSVSPDAVTVRGRPHTPARPTAVMERNRRLCIDPPGRWERARILLLGDGDSEDLLDGRGAFQHLQEPGLAQGLHALGLRHRPDVGHRRVLEDQIADLLADRHHLVNRDAPLHPGEAAGRAPPALVELRPAHPGQHVAVGQQRVLVHLVRLLAVLETFRPSRCAITSSSDEATRNGGIPMSINRAIVDGESLVCSVEKTKWPVSAARIEICAVSRSRVSPTRITSGSWRRKARNAAAKLRPTPSLIWT